MWLESEEIFLKNHYANTKNCNLSKKLNKSIKSVESKAFRMGLSKSKEYKSNYISKRNKKVGRDLNVENLTRIAAQFKTRSDFQEQDPSAYNTAKNNGILEDICKHMIKKSFSRPQLILKNIMDKLLKSESIYNDRKTIKPYEIDVYYPDFKLGLEYQGKFWHGKNFKKNNDNLKKELLLKKNINLIYIFEKNREYELDIKNQIKNCLDKINLITNKNISFSDVDRITVGDIYHKIYNVEEMFNVAKKYNTIKEFKQKEKYIWHRLNQIKKYKEATSHMVDKKNVYDKKDLTNVKNIISKYTELKDLIENEYGIYLYIKRNKELEYLLNGLNRKILRYVFNIDDIKKIISKYEKKCDFKKNNKEIYYFLKRKKLTQLISHLKKC